MHSIPFNCCCARLCRQPLILFTELSVLYMFFLCIVACIAGNSTCTKSSCQKEYLYRGYMQQYTESRYIKSVACTNMHNSRLINGIECMCMSHCL